jgi:hypothetical protein
MSDDTSFPIFANSGSNGNKMIFQDYKDILVNR